jgi:parvulin-like peptidyl-prolyl isomerase
MPAGQPEPALLMNKRLFTLLLVLLLVVLAAAGCGGGGKKSVPADAVAIVGGDTISKAQFNSLIAATEKVDKARKVTPPKPGTAAYKNVEDRVLGFLVQLDELTQKGKGLGVTVTDAQVQKQLDNVRKQYFNGDEKKFEAGLLAQGLTVDIYKLEWRSQLLSQAVYTKVTKNVKVTDAQIKAYYTAHKSSYSTAASRSVRHILVNSKALADSLYAKLVADHEKNFAALAKKYSKDPGSAANGGRLTITRGQTVPQFDKVAFSLKTGAIAKPIKTSYGWHIIQALSPVRPPSTTPLSKVKEQIRLQLEQQQKNTAMTNWVNDVKKEFCKPGKVKYESGFAPTTDPCASLTSATTTT